MKTIKFLFLVSPMLLVLSSSHATLSTPLMVNDSWGYYPTHIDDNSCTVYVGKTTNGHTIIKPPVYRVGGFIFSTTSFENCR